MTCTVNPLLDACLFYVIGVRCFCACLFFWTQCSSSDSHFQVFSLTSSYCGGKRSGAPYFSLSQLHPSSCSTIASILLSLSTSSSHCSMHYCPNPSCKWNLRITKKPFASAKSFSNHVQQSPECNHLCSSKLLTLLPPCRPLQKEHQQRPLLSCLRNSVYG